MGLCDDSDEERHDRFRSERNATTLYNSLSSKKSRLNSPAERDERRHGRYRRSRSRTRTRSRSRGKSKKTDRNHRSERHSSGRENSVKRKSRSSSRERRSRHMDRSVRKSDEDRKRRTSPQPSRVDTFLERFERRRPSPVDDEEPTHEDAGTMFYHDVMEEEDTKKRKDKKHHHHKREKRKRKKEEESLEPTPKKSPSVASKDVTTSDLLTLGDSYGPALPESKTYFKNGRSLDSSGTSDVSKMEEARIYGPVLPTSADGVANDGDDALSAQEGEVTSPSKKTSLHADPSLKIYGPSLPQDSTTGTAYGPALPPTLTVTSEMTFSNDVDDAGDDMIGPFPPGVDNTESLALSQLEARAALLKKQLENKDDDDEDDNTKRRESWMLELPDAKRAAMGLGARKFRSREGPDLSDRSSWTDTPADKERKREMARLGIKEDDTDLEVNSKGLEIRERDRDMEKKAKDSKRADKSLLEMHQKEMRKKKKREEKDGKTEERRPFSREVDLQTNKFDEAQKKSIIKKAQLLDSRFSRGESKYL